MRTTKTTGGRATPTAEHMRGVYARLYGPMTADNWLAVCHRTGRHIHNAKRREERKASGRDIGSYKASPKA